MDEEERRLQVALRMKAGRMLSGRRSKNRATALPVAELVLLPEMLDDRISVNRIEEIEQMSVEARRSELDSFVAALGLPVDWFGGLYARDRGEALKDSLAEVLLALAADARERHPGPEEAPRESDAMGRQRVNREADAG